NDGVLPLPKDLGMLAVIGPLAYDKKAPLGSWHCLGDPRDVVTVLEAVKRKVSPRTKVLYAKGCDIEGTSKESFSEAVEAARQSDAVIIVVGEKGDMSGEAASRAHLNLPGVQEELVKEIWRTGVPGVMVLMNGRPLASTWAAEHIPAIIEAWFLGLQAGNAIADVIFGDYNPGGKLPATFPRAVGQIPINYNHKSTGRPPDPENKYTSKYIDEDYKPLYPFGHGLSYTQFEYSDLYIEPVEAEPGDTVKISFTLANTGDREGDEVAQLYIRKPVASVTRPVKELKGFARVTLKPGEKRRVTFRMPTELLAFYNRQMKLVVEAGTYEVMVGSSSQDIRLKGRLRITRTAPASPRTVKFTDTIIG
ncbi:MAG: glycosyl hydrolase, partial [Thermoprotei archaeon]